MLRDSLAKFFKVDSLISNLTGYVETRIELLKIEAKEELTKGISSILVFLLMSFVFGVFIIFISVALALQIGKFTGTIWGFVIVSAFYLIVGFALLMSRENLIKKLEKKISVIINKKKNN